MGPQRWVQGGWVLLASVVAALFLGCCCDAQATFCLTQTYTSSSCTSASLVRQQVARSACANGTTTKCQQLEPGSAGYSQVSTVVGVPPITVKGVIFTAYNNVQDCESGFNVTSIDAQATDVCIPIHATLASTPAPPIRYYRGFNNKHYFWTSQIQNATYFATDCTGKGPDHQDTYDSSNIRLPKSCANSQRVATTVVDTGAFPPWLVKFLHDWYSWWDLQVAFGTISVIAGFFMLYLILDGSCGCGSGKVWTSYRKIVLALCLTQLIVDISYLAVPRTPLPYEYKLQNDDDVLKGKNSPQRSLTLSMLAIQFLRNTFTLSTCWISNLLTGIVFYIVIYSRVFSFRNSEFSVIALIVFISTIPCAIQVSSAVCTTMGNYGRCRTVPGTAISNYEMIRAKTELIDADFWVVFFTVASVAINHFFVVSSFLTFRYNSWSYSAMATGAGASNVNARISQRKQHVASLSMELITRIVCYPTIQMITQLPNLVESHIYFARDGDDDAWWKTSQYSETWYAYSLLVPTAGFWFCVAYIYANASARKKIASLALVKDLIPAVAAAARSWNSSSIWKSSSARGSESTGTAHASDAEEAAASSDMHQDESRGGGEGGGGSRESAADIIARRTMELFKLDEEELAAMLDREHAAEIAAANGIVAPGDQLPAANSSAIGASRGLGGAAAIELAGVVDNPMGRRL